ncbi:hypothetical protein Fcan01_22331 [Folsomia candida]|uniref:Uncharacterized protein n=1 Tax=Folsomia candida TaxID=158441 RepID=A0A226DFB8_FOLCA|nr:hypothetical protein Fcan01_22331 [Folsomia candida]
MGTAYATKKLPTNQTLTFITAYYFPRGNMILDGVENPAKLYLDNVPPKTAKTHHIEQIVWKSTTHMCMVVASGVAENGQYLTFQVAQYYPNGQGVKKLEEKVANIPVPEVTKLWIHELSSTSFPLHFHRSDKTLDP